MTPPVFSIISESESCVELLGAPPRMRLYLFGEAQQLTAKPYAVWQMISSTPANYLDQLPDIDGARVQIDVYADEQDTVREVAQNIRNALEPHGYMLNAAERGRDPTTRTYGFLMDFQFFTARGR